IPYDKFGESLPGERFIEQAAAGLQTTVVDLARFVAAGVKRNGAVNTKILKAETIQAMQTPQTASPTYGLGYDLTTINDRHFAGHTGANSGWMSGFLSNPEKGTGIVVLTNADNGQYVNAYLTCLYRRSEGALQSGTRCRRAAYPALLTTWRAGGPDQLLEKYAELRADSVHFSSAAGHLIFAGVALTQLTPARNDDAIKILTAATALFPREASAFENLADALIAKGDTARAIENYKRTVELDPKNDHVPQTLKKLLQK
ncbi:MAG TPA: serine hydrolase, partial [Gemmatimonadaceae bacterium]|nr:serine hydrolase [Gemmatimonadaceae bacterium]